MIKIEYKAPTDKKLSGLSKAEGREVLERMQASCRRCACRSRSTSLRRNVADKSGCLSVRRSVTICYEYVALIEQEAPPCSALSAKRSLP